MPIIEAKTRLPGTKHGDPLVWDVAWEYPIDRGSAITIDLIHVRVVDDIRLRFDFEAHEWVAEQELQAKSDHEPATGIWVEVARWSGNAPMAISSAENGTVEPKAEDGG